MKTYCEKDLEMKQIGTFNVSSIHENFLTAGKGSISDF